MVPLVKIKAIIRKWRNAPPPEGWLKSMIWSEWPDYEAWLFRYTFLSKADWLVQRKTSRRLARKPLVSILTPVYNVEPHFLEECVESVLFQSYPYWELLLYDDGSTRPDTLALLKKFETIDNRIKVYLSPENRGICKTTNHAIGNVKGEFVVFLDHDDKLAPQAIFEVAKVINNKPGIDIIYSDRDMISEGNLRFMHLFKPEWAPETILASNYLCHLTMYRTELLKRIGGLDQDTEGSQDHDLLLRAQETSPQIHHIPIILYHWRQHEHSVALNPESKEYAYRAASLSIEKALERRKLKGSVEELESLWRGNYRVKLEPFDLSEIYVHRIGGLHQVEWVDEFRKALECSAGESYIVFLGPEVEPVSEDAIQELTSWFHIADVVMTTGKIVSNDGKIIHAGLLYGDDGKVQSIYQGKLDKTTPGYMASASTVHNVSLPHPLCFALRREIVQLALEKLIDEQYHSCFVFSLALQCQVMEKRIVYTPFALFSCSKPEEITQVQSKESIGSFHNVWKDELVKGDPYFSPNLVLQNNDIALNFSRQSFNLPE